MVRRILFLLTLIAWSGLGHAQWAYKDVRDEMRNTVSKRATLTSLNTQPTRNGATILQIVAWDDANAQAPDERQVIGLAVSRGIINCPMRELCEFHVKADNEDPAGMHGQLIDDYDVLWLTGGSSRRLFEMFKSSKKLIIELPLYRANSGQFKFNVSPVKWAK